MACAIAFSPLLRCAAHVVGYQNLDSPTIQRSEADRQRALRIFAYEPCLGQCRIKLSTAAFQAIAPRSDPMKKLDAETSPPWRFSRLAHAARASLGPRCLDELCSSMSAYVASSLVHKLIPIRPAFSWWGCPHGSQQRHVTASRLPNDVQSAARLQKSRVGVEHTMG
jgi:hypothetical protein